MGRSVGFQNLCQGLGPVLLLPLVCGGTSPFWASVSPSVKWNEHFRLGTTAYWEESQSKSQDPCVQSPSDFEDNTYRLLAHWSSVVYFSFCKLHSQFGAVSEESCFSSEFLARGSCPVLQLRPLPSLTRHLAFSPGSAGLACSCLGVSADSCRLRGMDACSFGCSLWPWPGAHGLPACFGNGPGAALPGPAGSRLGQGCGEWQVLTPGCTLAGHGASHPPGLASSALWLRCSLAPL